MGVASNFTRLRAAGENPAIGARAACGGLDSSAACLSARSGIGRPTAHGLPSISSGRWR